MSQILKHLPRFDIGRLFATHGYERHLSRKLRQHRHDPDLAFAQAIGSESVELFNRQGDGQVAILKYHGLADGMTVFDLGCGSGRTALALQRGGWTGRYIGTDIIPRFVTRLKKKCPDYEAFVQRSTDLDVLDDSLDLAFHWSVFTHVAPEQCYLYLVDTYRALKPGGKLVFSFLELTEPAHRDIFRSRVRVYGRSRRPGLLDTFLHRDWISWWAQEIGFADLTFTNGLDDTDHPACWQAVAAMRKPG